MMKFVSSVVLGLNCVKVKTKYCTHTQKSIVTVGSDEFHTEQPRSLGRVCKRVSARGAKQDPAETCMADVLNMYR